MPRFLKASDIPMSKRKPYLDRYRSQLREALSNPALPATQRARVKMKLEALGHPKPYADLAKVELPVTLPALSEEAPKTALEARTLEDLMKMTKAQLRVLADEEGISVSTSWKKQQIAEALL